jgi:hypothetical protein
MFDSFNLFTFEQLPQLKLPFYRHGSCAGTPKANPRRIYKHSKKYPLLSFISQETEARTLLITSRTIQELPEWTKGKGWLEST